MMKTIALGTHLGGLTVSQLGFGCMGLTSFYGSKLPDEAIIDILSKTVDLGVSFWDTANLYVYFDPWRLLQLASPIVCQEEIIGKAIAKIGRDKIQIATKTGIEVSVFPKLKVAANGHPNFIREQCEASLKRLGVDSLDLFYLHRIDQTIPIEVSMWTLKQLVEEGKVKHVGLSECSAATIRRAHKVHPLTAVQMEYSLWYRGIEKDVLPACKELGIGLVAYSPLGRGFFGGAASKELEKGDFRNNQERFKSERNLEMLKKLTAIAEAKGVTPAQLALAWVEAQQHRAQGVVSIPGTTKEKNLMSNVESTKIVLSQQDLDDIEAAVPWEEVEGNRYAEQSASNTWEFDQNPPLTKEIAIKFGLPESIVAE